MSETKEEFEKMFDDIVEIINGKDAETTLKCFFAIIDANAIYYTQEQKKMYIRTLRSMVDFLEKSIMGEAKTHD